MESSFEKSKIVYLSKIPEIEQALELINLMKIRKENEESMVTHYSLCDTLYAAAEVNSIIDSVCINFSFLI
jgi:hypothetical protein